MSVIERVIRFARRHDLWRPETRVIAAVSGGSDSVALLFLLRDLHERGELMLDAVAHLNHAIRGAAADEDETFCRLLAERLNTAFVSTVVDVPAHARRDGVSIEVAARRARQRFFTDVRSSRGADAVATAHTRDDQAETVLLRLARGTGLRGLGGIAPRRDALIRPLLQCSRLELREELSSRSEQWREDETNRDLTNPRNRVRHELLPYLQREFNPSIADALARLANLARADEAVLDELAAAAALRVSKTVGSNSVIDGAALCALPAAVARRVIQKAFAALGANLTTLKDVDLVRAVAAGECRSAQLCGVRVEHSGGCVVLVQDVPHLTSFRFDLPIPGYVRAPDAGWVLKAAGPQPPRRTRPTSPDEVEVEAAGLGTALVVRSRQSGDRLRPLGLGGTKKVQDVFVDRKVSRLERDQVPIVTDDRGRIVWVAGHALAEEFRVTDRTNAVVVLKLRRV